MAISALAGDLLDGTFERPRDLSSAGVVRLLRDILFHLVLRSSFLVSLSLNWLMGGLDNRLGVFESPFYRLWALHPTNLVSSLGTLSTSDGKTITSSITSFSDAEMIAPYASVLNTAQTYFSFTEANADGISHFREFGNGVIGLEDLYGGGDNDFDDLIFGFDLKLTV